MDPKLVYGQWSSAFLPSPCSLAIPNFFITCLKHYQCPLFVNQLLWDFVLLRTPPPFPLTVQLLKTFTYRASLNPQVWVMEPHLVFHLYSKLTMLLSHLKNCRQIAIKSPGLGVSWAESLLHNLTQPLCLSFFTCQIRMMIAPTL